MRRVADIVVGLVMAVLLLPLALLLTDSDLDDELYR